MFKLGVTELVIILSVFVGIVFWIWMLIDCAIHEPSGNDKIVWIIIIAVTHVIGAAIYFFVKRPQRTSTDKSSQ